MSTISMNTIMLAINHYKKMGYNLIDVPMCVDIDVSEKTRPNFVKDLHHSPEKVYVGSAEQSFIQLHKENNLPNGKFMALTPCNREESILDETHYLSFLKLELINVGSNDSLTILKHSKSFFDRYLKTQITKTNEAKESYDLITSKDQIEIGSYGVRKMIDGTEYTFGTGIAEPRFSVLINKENL